MKSESAIVVGKKVVVAILLGIFCTMYVSPQNVNAATDAELKAQIAELTRILLALKAQLASSNMTSGGDAPVVVTDWFPEPVVFEAENDSVKLLQEILKTDPSVYPEGTVTGYYGGLTKNAVAALQAKFNLPVTGDFNGDVKYVLNYALSSVSFKTYPSSYLLSDKGLAAVRSGVLNLTIRDQVVNGVVVLGTNPVFSATTPTADTATIQRILITAGVYRGLKVTGIMDTMTMQSVSEFLRTYGVPFVIPDDGVLRPDSLMTEKTISLFRQILVKNASSTIAYNLLTRPDVQPEVLIPNNTRTLSAVRAIRDYRADNTMVKVFYDGGFSEEFISTVVSPNRSVAAAIATKLNRGVSEITPVIVYESVFGKDYKTIKLSVYTSNAMVLDIEYKDSTKESINITDEDVKNFVAFSYQGDTLSYQADFDYYVEKARRGEPIEKVYELVADTLRTTKDKVRSILTIDVEQYTNDQCATNYYCNISGA